MADEGEAQWSGLFSDKGESQRIDENEFYWMGSRVFHDKGESQRIRNQKEYLEALD